MTPLRLRFLLLFLISATLCACNIVHPHGALKDVVDGKIFENHPRNPAQEKKDEESKRQLERQTPQPKEDAGAVQFRIPL